MAEGKVGDQDPNEQELIDSEFESMVSELSLDQSAPTTYLDELDNRDDSYRPELPEKESFRETLSRAQRAFRNWFTDRSSNNNDGDGAAI